MPTSAPPVRLPVGALLAAALAYLSWGLLPLYFKALGGVAATQILAHRVLWSVLLLAALVPLQGGLSALAAARPHARALAATTVLLATNWLLYIWAVNNDHVMEASLGYFITPLVNVALGIRVLGERLNRVQKAAVALGVLGVAAPLVLAGRPPWVALGLAGSFGLYGLLRKRLPVPAVPALLIEAAGMAPLALCWLGWLALQGEGAFGQATRTDLLLVGTGLITTVPLLLFAVGARRLPLSTMGLLQYLSPTGQLLLAVFAFGEPFTRTQALTFSCIWTGLLLTTADALWRRRGVAART